MSAPLSPRTLLRARASRSTKPAPSAPPWRPAGGAPAAPPVIGPPALDAVRAAPRRPLDDIHLVRRRMGVAKGRRADELDLGIGAQDAQRRRQRHLAEAVVVAVGLAVDRDGDYALVVGERGAQALGELDPVPQKLAEGDTLRELRLTKEHVDEASARQDAAVEAADVE